jgi:hypothetical protein
MFPDVSPQYVYAAIDLLAAAALLRWYLTRCKMAMSISASLFNLVLNVNGFEILLFRYSSILEI